MRLEKLITLAGIGATFGLAVASPSPVGSWSGSSKPAGTVSGNKTESQESQTMRYSGFIPYAKLRLIVNSNKTYLLKLDYGSDHETSKGTWTIKDNKLILNGDKNKGPLLLAEVGRREFTMAADGKTLTGQYPGLYHTTLRTLYRRVKA